MLDEQPDGPAPQSVAELTADPAWTVTRTGTRGQWLTAERVVQQDGHRRVVGLTPIRPGTVAVMLWSDGDVVEHARGSEADACTTAHRWVAKLLADGQL
ncbi:hypothetical protein [Amycolatopsis plumensis]|uniref:Uncharacterized protein n=1 Tax=Amycolatopsis plumensis TaxID=236508 RepID=A0ABV5UM36_9PSEU